VNVAKLTLIWLATIIFFQDTEGSHPYTDILVNCIANLPSFFVRLTGKCDYLYQTNIYIPQVYYLTLLLSTCLLPDTTDMW